MALLIAAGGSGKVTITELETNEINSKAKVKGILMGGWAKVDLDEYI